MKHLVAAGAFALAPFGASAADLPARTPAPAPESIAVHSWSGFYVGGNAGFLNAQNANRMEYKGAQPNGLAFNTLKRPSISGFVDPAVRSLSTPTLGSLSGPLPLFATADAPVGYYGTVINTNSGATPPNNTAQINDRSTAANQAALDSALASGALPGSLIGRRRDLFNGGVALGYNNQFSSIVIGVEADYSYLGRNAGGAFAAGAPVVAGVNPLSISLGGGDYITTNGLIQGVGNNEALWLATARGRIGFAVDRALIFATGGFAVGRVKSSAAVSANATLLGLPVVDAIWSGSYSKTRLGWALGGGLEYAVTDNWAFKAEYLHYDLGKHAYSLKSVNPDSVLPHDSGDYSLDMRANARTLGDIVRIGVSYRFGS